MNALPPIGYGAVRPVLLALAFISISCCAAQWEQHSGFRSMAVQPQGRSEGFTRISPAETGLAFTNHLSRRAVAINRVTENGSGVALGDIDADGLCDIYLCRLEGDNALYRNLGNWKFEDITARAGVACPNQFSTGAVLADIDGDGDLDLLVNSIGGGTREFRNDGRGVFKENMGRLVRRFATTSASLGDIDRDGDLDLYVATYRSIVAKDDIPPVKIEARQVNGKIVISPEGRYEVIAPRSGNVEVAEVGERDFLYLNQGNGQFASISWTNNFLGTRGTPLAFTPLDWGLSVMIRDLNDDLLPDIFVCNDFFYSQDRVWLNSLAGKFHTISFEAMAKFSMASMAVDVADINRDGHDDIFVAEMLSRDHAFRQVHRDNLDKAALNEIVLNPEYRPEVPRNTLYLNRGNGTYAEIAEFSGVDASDWSWGAIFLDIDLDGFEDLVIPTGNNHDVQQADVLRQIKRLRVPDSIPQRMANLERLGTLRTPILAFHNQRDLTFAEHGADWGFSEPGIVNGMACADLDNDGDLDLVGNALNDALAVYRNESTKPRVAVRLNQPGPNRFGVGAKVTVVSGGLEQSQQITSGNRYLSNDDYLRTFAALSSTITIKVRWPSGLENTYPNLPANRIYEFSPLAGTPARPEPRSQPLFADVSALLNHSHLDEPFSDNDRQPLLPHKLSSLGPGISWFDENGDGWEDLVIGTGRGGSLALFHNLQGRFVRATNTVYSTRAALDQTTILGASLGNKPTLLVGQSNYELALDSIHSVAFVHDERYSDSLAIPGSRASTGPLAMADIDRDGDLDLFVGSRVQAARYPDSVSSRIFLNDGGQFILATNLSATLANLGLVSAATFADLDHNGWPDLLLATEWGSLRLLLNDQGSFTDATSGSRLSEHKGLWNSVASGDFDNDGRLDIVAGNWGLNCKYRRYLSGPIRLYHGDLEKNGTYEIIEAFVKTGTGKTFPWQDFDTLHKSIPSLGELVASYTAYSTSTVEELFGPALQELKTVEANWLASTLFLNRGTHFEPKPLPAEAQFAPAFGIAIADFNGDGNEDAFLAQNFFGAKPDQGKLDAGCGLLLIGDGRGNLLTSTLAQSGIFSVGDQRGAAVSDFDHDGRPDLAFAQNNGPTRLYRNTSARPGIRIRLQGTPDNRNAVGAQIHLVRNGTLGKVREVQSGSGYWSQDANTQVWVLSEGDALQVRWPNGKTTRHPVSGKENEVVLAQD